jgi:hypothetical protein
LDCFLLAGVVHADAVGTSSGTLYIPAGSTVTSITNSTVAGFPSSTIDFTFAGGTGVADGGVEFGEGGVLNFDAPLSSITFDWEGFIFTASDNLGDSFNAVDPDGNIMTSGTVTFILGLVGLKFRTAKKSRERYGYATRVSTPARSRRETN